MKLSIIIPVYNEELYLRRCLDSIRADDQIEVIIVDDNSTDKSWEIAHEYRDFKILDRLDANAGVSVARNRGIEASTGEYITFLDSDDEISEGGLDTMLAVIKASRCDILQFNHYRCHDGKCKVESKYHSTNGRYTLTNMPAKWAVVWNKVYKRSLIIDHNIRFNEGQQFDEDRNFNLRCLKYTEGIDCHKAYILNKHFDNSQSLCHTVDQDKLIKAIQANADLLREPQTPDMVKLIRHSIKMHLYSSKFENAFRLK